jgi:hypothetical protein
MAQLNDEIKDQNAPAPDRETQELRQRVSDLQQENILLRKSALLIQLAAEFGFIEPGLAAKLAEDRVTEDQQTIEEVAKTHPYMVRSTSTTEPLEATTPQPSANASGQSDQTVESLAEPLFDSRRAKDSETIASDLKRKSPDLYAEAKRFGKEKGWLA